MASENQPDYGIRKPAYLIFQHGLYFNMLISAPGTQVLEGAGGAEIRRGAQTCNKHNNTFYSLKKSWGGVTLVNHRLGIFE